MSQVLEGDEWKHAADTAPARTRADVQRDLDAAYAAGRITREQWSAGFDALSIVTSDLQIMRGPKPPALPLSPPPCAA